MTVAQHAVGGPMNASPTQPPLVTPRSKAGKKLATRSYITEHLMLVTLHIE